MKTVSGSVISSTPISLSKAASFLNDFGSAKQNGASQAASAFLRRTSTAFTELIQFHQQLEIEISEKKEKKRHYEELENRNIDKMLKKEAKFVEITKIRVVGDGKSHRGNVDEEEEEKTVVFSKSLDLGNAQSVSCIENGWSVKKKKKKEMSEVKVQVVEKKVREPGGGSSQLEGGSGKRKKKKRGEVNEVKQEEVTEPEEVRKANNNEKKKRKKVENESTTSLDNSEERHSRMNKKRRHDD